MGLAEKVNERVRQLPEAKLAQVLAFVEKLTQEARPSPPQNTRLTDPLRELAARGGVSGIADPEEWQRQQREDRALPGRG